MSDQQAKANQDHHANQKNPNSSACQDCRDHHANQGNPNNPAHQAAVDNRANQMNPNNATYEASRTGGSGSGVGDGKK
jgi:hypothetical protein